jgi:hypothetical protein
LTSDASEEQASHGTWIMASRPALGVDDALAHYGGGIRGSVFCLTIEIRACCLLD